MSMTWGLATSPSTVVVLGRVALVEPELVVVVVGRDRLLRRQRLVDGVLAAYRRNDSLHRRLRFGRLNGRLLGGCVRRRGLADQPEQATTDGHGRTCRQRTV